MTMVETYQERAGKMIILYGMGLHARKIAREYAIPLNEIEVIIDNNLVVEGMCECVGIISWSEYLLTRERYESATIVIGAGYRFDEIRKDILDSKLFEESNILGIEEWAESKFKKVSLLADYVDEIERDSICRLSWDIGEVPQSLLDDAKLLQNREAPLKLLPKKGRAAEIGVAYGEFSNKILENMQPEVFYAIDMYVQKEGFWGGREFATYPDGHLGWYKKEFSDFIDKGIVKIKQGISWEVLASFPDNYFDYIYLDAAHDYASVKKDITQILKKIKPEGVVQFNDYYLKCPGVIAAANEMIKETCSKILYYCIYPDGNADIVVRVNK